MATITFAPLTSLFPDCCTWIAARVITVLYPAVGSGNCSLLGKIRYFCSSINLTKSLFKSDKLILQALRRFEASVSSIKAKRRCSTVTCSWFFLDKDFFLKW